MAPKVKRSDRLGETQIKETQWEQLRKTGLPAFIDDSRVLNRAARGGSAQGRRRHNKGKTGQDKYSPKKEEGAGIMGTTPIPNNR